MSRVSKMFSRLKMGSPWSYVVVGLVALTLIILTIMLVLSAMDAPGAGDSETDLGSPEEENDRGSSTVAPDAVLGTVPELVGLLIDDARPLLEDEGLKAAARSTFDQTPEGTVLTQDPDAGELMNVQQPVILLISSGPAPGKSADAEASSSTSSTATSTTLTAQSPEPSAQKYSGSTVVIDPGHQMKGNSDQEPIGPASSTTKAKVSQGASGVSTRIPEYKLTLDLSKRLKSALESVGVKVVMTRTTHDVDISNSERAKVGNDSSADLAIRIHADGNNDSSVRGVSTLYPGSNEWTGSITGTSKQAAQLVQDAVVASTGRQNRGLSARTDITGFNWSEVPVILAEIGFLSNADEDNLINSDAEKARIVEGLKTGVLAYLDSQLN